MDGQFQGSRVVDYIDELDEIFASLMVFYKGGLNYDNLNNMPIEQVFYYYKIASKMQKEAERIAKQKK